jgi:hypothetical protein
MPNFGATSDQATYTKITTNATTVIKSGAGILRSLFVSAPGTSWTFQIVDNTVGSGTAIVGATAVTVPAAGTTIDFKDVLFNTGLTVVTAGTTPGEITITWK